MASAKIKSIEKVMEILARYFNYTERTTLNRMRKKPDAFKILISCLLSLRARDENTEKVVKRLFKHVKGPEDIVKMPTKRLERLIYESGFYKRKARILKHVARVILEEYGGKVPASKEELLKIRGIGPKTANIVLAFAFKKDALPIDTHCHRIPNRLGWIRTKTPEQTEKALEKLLPKKYWKEFNALFVLFGKTICKPVSPLCSICPVRDYCKRVGVERRR